MFGRSALFACKMPPQSIVGHRGCELHALFGGGMFHAEPAGMEADAAIGIRPCCTVFQVALYGATDEGELGPDLMVPAREGVHLDQKIAV